METKEEICYAIFLYIEVGQNNVNIWEIGSMSLFGVLPQFAFNTASNLHRIESYNAEQMLKLILVLQVSRFYDRDTIFFAFKHWCLS